MHKISNFTGSARPMWERMTPSMGFGGQRQQHDMPPMQSAPQPSKQPREPQAATAASAAPPRQALPGFNTLHLSFNIPFSSTLAGPEPSDVIHATNGALVKWSHPDGTELGTPTHKLPVHAQNVDNLRNLCQEVSDKSKGRLQAMVVSSEPKALPGLQLGGPLRAMVTNVCLSGDSETVRKMRGAILKETPISLRCTNVDLDQNLALDPSQGPETVIRQNVLDHINHVAEWTGTDIFLLNPKQNHIGNSSFTSVLDSSLDQRFRIAIYGDMECSEHAKTRILMMIDLILKRKIDVFKLELMLHPMVSGRLRRHVKHIESATDTAIYFPPPFPQVYGYCPPGAHRRSEDEIFITSTKESNIYHAKGKLHELARSTHACVKEIRVSPEKVDSMLLERLDKLHKVMEYNGSYIQFPPLGSQRGVARVQGTDMLHVERTVREVMSICGQFYTASWWITSPDQTQKLPTTTELKNILADICVSSGAEVGFEKLTFHVSGSDDAVKAALFIVNSLPFIQNASSHLRIKIELANEHKEFVSGKKNGKINKIMSQSNVQVFFDLFNEYNFFIDVSGGSYEAARDGLDLVESEMPASIAFHVPDQYHKRIIGIGGQHIQRIMKKYSVFVKFSNAMDRGGVSKEDDDIKVDNVICRTPSRNAQSLDQVKQEIMDMVERVDAEFVSQPVVVNRLFHRELLARMAEIEDLEKKWNCKITFPSTEEASDVVTITGPEFQIPQIVDDFLGMVPERHEISLDSNDELSSYFGSSDFQLEVIEKLKSQYEVDLQVHTANSTSENQGAKNPKVEVLTLAYTLNNAGGVKDAIDFLTDSLVAHGLDKGTVKGAIPRPKSDSFEESLPFFESKLLHRAGDSGSSRHAALAAAAAAASDSPTSSTSFSPDHDGFNEQHRSLLDKIRSKPGSIASFLDRRKNSRSPGPPSSATQAHPPPNSMMKYASSKNVSKASLASVESQSSAYSSYYRNSGSSTNPWNDSSVTFEEDDNGGWPPQFSGKNASASDLSTKSAFSLHYAGSSVSLSGGSSTALPRPGSSGSFPPPASMGFGMTSASSLPPPGSMNQGNGTQGQYPIGSGTTGNGFAGSSGVPLGNVTHSNTANGGFFASGMTVGDVTPKHESRMFPDSGRPSTSNSFSANATALGGSGNGKAVGANGGSVGVIGPPSKNGAST